MLATPLACRAPVPHALFPSIPRDWNTTSRKTMRADWRQDYSPAVSSAAVTLPNAPSGVVFHPCGGDSDVSQHLIGAFDGTSERTATAGVRETCCWESSCQLCSPAAPVLLTFSGSTGSACIYTVVLLLLPSWLGCWHGHVIAQLSCWLLIKGRKPKGLLRWTRTAALVSNKDI